MAVNVAGLVSIIVFYLIILVVGIIAARKTGLRVTKISRDDVMMANKSIGLFVGIFTMTATWVGGGYINGTTEAVASGSGLVWCQAPIGYSIALILGGLVFSDKMRDSGFTTLLDPFLHKYGRVMGCLLFLPALVAEVFWSGSILAALGATLKVILDIDLTLSIVISAGISLLYTLMGGLYSVAYTDVVQLICIFIGLWVGVPFAMTHKAARSITADTAWLGAVETPYIGSFVDYYLLLIFGGIPWQVYWQRALSAKTSKTAKGLSIIGGVGCIIMAVPAVLLGAIAHNADWSETGYGNLTSLKPEDLSMTLPLVFFHMTPTAVTFIGLGAVSAAVMSSTDSSFLSASTMFAVNVFAVIHTAIWGNKPSDTVVVWVMRGSQVVIAAMACLMAIQVSSIYYLFSMCSDFVYVVLFPQLVCVLFVPWSNSYGSLAGFILGLLFRLLGGEKGLNLPPTIEYPWYIHGEGGGQQFPFRTLSMLISLFSLLLTSLIAKWLFTSGCLPPGADVFRCFRRETSYELEQHHKASEKHVQSGVHNTGYEDTLPREAVATKI